MFIRHAGRRTDKQRVSYREKISPGDMFRFVVCTRHVHKPDRQTSRGRERYYLEACSGSSLVSDMFTSGSPGKFSNLKRITCETSCV